MAQEQIRELLDLIAVHGFYMDQVKRALGHAVPMPHDASEAVTNLHGRIRHSIEVLRRWLALLDMAITPPMVRDGLKGSTSLETAEALLRYFITKTSKADYDRDKCDFVVTYLYRINASTMAGSGEEAVLRFERGIAKILVLMEVDIPEMPPEHLHLVEEFAFIREEVEDFRHFDDLMDAGIVQRVREIKQSLRESFYHPHALATVADYNVFFGNRFDELFRNAAKQIKAYAARVQEEGGSKLSRVDGDVTVEHLEKIQDEQALKLEYGRAQDQFRKISRFKKAVDKRAGSRSAVAAAPAPARAQAAVAGVRSAREPEPPVRPVAPVVTPASPEESKIEAAADAIRNFNRTAGQAGGSVIVPLPHGNVVLSAGESEAFKADFGKEKSFRADYAHCLVRMVAIQARMAAEMKDFNAKRSSAYLWKPHADALAYLLAAANREIEGAGRLGGLAHDRGLGEKVTAIKASAEKLRIQTQQVAAALQQ